MQSGASSGVFGVQRIGMTEVKSYSKHWPCLFPQHGPGMKHTRKIELAGWQQVIVDRYPGDFARGLFHSDGCRGMNRVRRVLAERDHWYEYPRYLFVNESKDILGLCGEALDRLGVEWRFARPDVISVAFHSDGYRGVNRVRRRWTRDHWYDYPRYLFVNKSEDILQLCGETLDRLGVEWRFSKPNTISVAKQDAVARLDEFVGPKY